MQRVTLLTLGLCTFVSAISNTGSSTGKREDSLSSSTTRRQASSSSLAQTASQGNLYYYYYPVQEKKRQSTGDYDTSASNYNPLSASYGSNFGQNFDSSQVYQGAATNQDTAGAVYGGQATGFGGSNFGGLGAAADISQINSGGYGSVGQLAAATGSYGINAGPGQAAAGGYGLGTAGGISQLNAAGYGGAGGEGFGGLGAAAGPSLSQFVPGSYGATFGQIGGYGGNGAGNVYGQYGAQGGIGGYGQGNYGGLGDLQPAASATTGSYGGESHSAFGLGSLIMPMLALAGLGLLLPSVSSSLTSSNRRKRETEETMDVFSGYRSKLEKYYAIYRSAMKNEQCLNRVICELGNAMSDAKDKVSIISILAKYMPEKIRSKMEVFETAALSTKMGKCYKYKC
ncbi:keratin, type I cytoskeletal 10-like [Limulus polyphemus]|uniref:Keratin, type I cytoskeletal 10-like n=1 Tax=Limulus polyphemus TaxID=6850 RepID=A0ABM1BSD7_LIMPO|nr:keratin, type I cytoskeletal 10-like [Limulus polyphemus]